MPYVVGDLIRVSATFIVDGVNTDPTTITIKHKTPTGMVVTKVFPTDFEVVKESVGKYRRDISVTEGGTWHFRWEATGAAQGAAQDKFDVTAATA